MKGDQSGGVHGADHHRAVGSLSQPNRKVSGLDAGGDLGFAQVAAVEHPELQIAAALRGVFRRQRNDQRTV